MPDFSTLISKIEMLDPTLRTADNLQMELKDILGLMARMMQRVIKMRGFNPMTLNASIKNLNNDDKSDLEANLTDL